MVITVGAILIEAILIGAALTGAEIDAFIIAQATHMGATIDADATSDNSYIRNWLSLPRQNASIARLS